MKNILTTKQVADELGVQIRTVYSYIKNKSLKATKIGGNSSKRHWRIKRIDFEAFLNSGRGVEQNTLGEQNANS